MRMILFGKGCGLLIIFALLLASACKNYKDFDPIEGIDYSGEMAVPLVQSSASLQDLIDEGDITDELSSLVINPDGSMKLVYENSQVSENIAALYEKLPSFPLAIVENSNEYEIQLFEDMEVQEMKLKTGTLSFQLQSYSQEDVDVLITLPNLTRDGAVFNVSKTIAYDGNSPTEVSIPPLDMSGYTLTLENNMMQLYYQAVNSNGDNIQISPIIGMAENWDYDFIKGSWATDTFELTNDTMQIEIYDNWIGGDITFEDPRLSIVINNSFGFPAMANINELRVLTADGETMLLESTVLDNGLQMNYPGLTEIGQSKETILDLNNSNSNIADILNAKPQQIIYNISAIVNPEGSTSTSGFMTDESAIDLMLHTELPMYGTASGFEIEEPLETNLDDLDNIESAEFKIIVDNGMPLAAGIQLYFLDPAGNKIDSLYSGYESIIESAVTGNDGMVTSSTETTSLITFSAERMEKIKQSSSMLVAAEFSTANNGSTPVQIFTNHEMSVKVGLKVKLTD